MRNTTLCYIIKDGSYLMLYRNKKENDVNGGKWVGVGGKFEAGETPEQCLLREVREETGLLLTAYTFRGIVHFRSDAWEDEEMYLYTGEGFEGELSEGCAEGELHWIPIPEVMNLSLWEGDKIFLKMLTEDERNIDLTLRYEGDTLTEAKLG